MEASVGSCPKCDAQVIPGISPFCEKCGKTLPQDLVERRIKQFEESIPSTRSEQATPPVSEPSVLPLQSGPVVTGLGVLLLLFAFVRWNSMESQFLRAVGQGDGLGSSLFLVGVVTLGIGVWLLMDSSSSRNLQSPARQSVEERLRQLDDLRAKQLISEAQYEQRKSEIIASV